MNDGEAGLRSKVASEVKKTLGVSLYLALFLGAFATYRRMLLAEYQISYLHYGYSVIEALVLAKVIVIGSALGVGERFRQSRLIVPTLYKTLCFSILVLAFSVLEHLVTGWLHGKATRVIWHEMLEPGLWEILTRVLTISLALVPLFAVWEAGRVLGEERLSELFFCRRTHQSYEAGSIVGKHQSYETGSIVALTPHSIDRTKLFLSGSRATSPAREESPQGL